MHRPKRIEFSEIGIKSISRQGDCCGSFLKLTFIAKISGIIGRISLRNLLSKFGNMTFPPVSTKLAAASPISYCKLMSEN